MSSLLHVPSPQGEGSHGGSIIGHTKSGKPIYGLKHAKAYKHVHADSPDWENSKAVRASQPNFTHQDHTDAYHAHMQEASAARGPDKELSAVAIRHVVSANAHKEAAKELKMSNLRVVKGEGSRGGVVMGHTRSGKPVYHSDALHYQHISKLKGTAQQKAMNKQFEGWTADDHRDAMDMHDALIPGPNKRKAKATAHFKAAQLHYNKRATIRAGETGEESYYDMKSLTFNFKKSEGSRGGQVVSHTQTGRPVYARSSGGPPPLPRASSGPKPPSLPKPPRAPVAPAQAPAKVMGHTSRGNNIYTHGAAGAHPHYTPKEHLQASSLHQQAAYIAPNKAWADHHQSLADSHMAAYETKKTGLAKSDTPDLMKAKGEGSKGGSIIGHTRSGKPIYGPGHPVHVKLHRDGFGTNRTNLQHHAQTVHDSHSDYTEADHSDASFAHLNAMQQTDDAALAEQHATLSGAHGLASSRMKLLGPSWKRASKKSDTPDFAKGLFDIANMMQEQMALQNAEVERVTFPQRVDVLNPGGDGGVPTDVRQVNLTPPGSEQDTLTFRVDILAPTPLSTMETLAMAKSIQQLPRIEQQTELVRCGLNVVGPRKVSLSKSTMSLVEFADAVGTTEDTVRRLAKRCGDPQHFVTMIRDKMPDIQRAHSLTDSDAEQLYATASRTLKSLTPQQWGQWCSKSFATQQVTDQGLAEAIQMNGFMHRNQCTSQGFSVMGGPVVTEPHQELASPEPISKPPEMRPLIGGNLALGVRSTDVGPNSYR